jgi:DNA N-6-adenine-methyltransferase (Dam)
MADEIDAAQKKGELACVGRPQMVRGADNSSPARLRDLGVPRQRIAEWREVRDAGDQVVQEAIEEALLEGRAPTKADIARRIRGPKDAGEHEWETPVEFVDAVRSVLGEIDLDPASSRHAQETIRAGRYFTKETDGLAHDWKGRVWLNPPQQEPQILDFADKMVAQLVCGNVAVAIMLTPNSTDMAWFQKLSLYAKAICFPRGRVRFVTPDGSLAAPRHGQAIFYFGDDVPAFASAFKEIGFVLVSFRACRPAAPLNGARPRPGSGCVPKDVAPGEGERCRKCSRRG